jgi:hypothetical protein
MKTATFSAQRLTTDALFGVQLCFTFIFGGSQFYRMLTTQQGVNLSWFLCWLIFLLLKSRSDHPGPPEPAQPGHSPDRPQLCRLDVGRGR